MELYIEKSPTFDLAATLNCGQVFRYREEGGETTLCAGGHRAVFRDEGEGYSAVCDDAE